MKVGIIGATGYGGLELIRFLHNHPEVEKLDLFTSSDEGTIFSSRFGHLLTIYDEPLKSISAEKLSSYDVVFTSTPSGVTSELLPPLVAVGPKLIDLSGDYRLKDPNLFKKWYKKNPAPKELLTESVYGLSEWNEVNIKNASIIANPGCYPTATLLSILPLIKERLIDPNYLIIDAKSGVSGAGNKPSQTTHFSEMNENLAIYKINSHQHIPEIEQAIEMFTEVKTTISFNTHLVPMTRGILTTTYAPVVSGVSNSQLVECLIETYKNNPFVRVITDATSIGTNRVKGSNYCDILVKFDDRTNRVTIIAVIDNLVKGAAGQAIQNMNIAFDFPQTSGLNTIPLFI
nr:N-acetyl-gamma-glutamyl-phosphate reductase [Lysinibacillus timonensis]